MSDLCLTFDLCLTSDLCQLPALNRLLRLWSRHYKEGLPPRCLLLSVLHLLSVGLLLLLLSLYLHLPRCLLVTRKQVQDGDSALSQQ